NALWVRWRDRHRQPAVRLFRKTFVGFGRDLDPGRAAIRGAEQPAGRWFVRAVAAGTERPAFPPKIPHAGEEEVRIVRIHRDPRRAGRGIPTLQNLVPGLAAIRCFVEAPIGRIAPERSGHRRINRVAARRTHDDFRDPFRVRQPGEIPGLATVDRFINAVADRHAVARPAFAGADPDVLRIFRIERDGADRLHRLLVEDRLVTGPAVFRFPDAAAGRADEDREFAVGLADRVDRRDAAAHRGRADIARAETGDRG